MNRHWVLAALGLAAGILPASFLPPDPFWAAPSLAALVWGAALVWVLGRLPFRDTAAVLGCCMGLGALLYALAAPPPGGDALARRAVGRPGQLVTIEGVVRQAPALVGEGESCRFILRADTIALPEGNAGLPVSHCAVSWRKPKSIIADGDRVRVTGRLNPGMGSVNHGLSGYETVMRRRGVFCGLEVQPSALELVTPGRWSPRRWVSRWRQWQAARLAENVPEPALPFALGVWLGERSGLGGDAYQRYVLSGTAHILSVSGIHVGLVYLALAFVLGIPLRNRRLRALLVMAGIFAFALAAGARLSTLRAALMAATVLVYDLFDREPDTPSALGIAGFLMLALSPNSLFDTGFLLSYTAMASLLLFQRPLAARLTQVPGILRGPVATGLSAQALTLPLAAWHFQVLPLAGLAANLLVVPLLGVALWLCLAVVAAALLLPPAALLAGHALAPVVALIEGTVALAAAVPGGHSLVPPPTVAALVLWTAACLALRGLLSMERPARRRMLAAAALFGLSLFFWRPAYPPGTVDFLDVGHADAAFLMTPSGATLLVDGGNLLAGRDAGKDTVAPFLRAHGIRRIDAVAVTHADSDHIGGVLHIVRTFPVGRVWLGPKTGTTHVLEQALLDLCEERGVSVVRVAAGDAPALDGARVDVLHPPPGGLPHASDNDNSLALRVSWPELSVLFAGDIERAGERALAVNDCRADILKAPHHGSATSNSGALLDAVRPRAVVVSTRATSRLPALGRGVMETYQERGIPVWRTDWHGGVRLHADGGAVTLLGARETKGYSLQPLETP